MTEYSSAAGARRFLDQQVEERMQQINATKVVKDASNKATIEGLPYKLTARGESILVHVDMFKTGYECKKCFGSGKMPPMIHGGSLLTCDACGGKGGLLVFTDESKKLPTTGVVISIGPKVQASDLKLYDRVLFGEHSGQFIPARAAGVLLKVMHEREATLTVEGGEETASTDFVLFDKPMEDFRP